MTYLDEARIVFLAFRKQMDRKERNTFSILASRWSPIREQLSRMLGDLVTKEILSDNDVFLNSKYREFLRQTEQLIGTYNTYALSDITDSQEYFGKIGIRSSEKILELSYSSFPRINSDAFNSFVGVSLDGTPLSQLLEKSFPALSEKISDTIGTGIALGWNIEKTSRILRDSFEMPMYRAIRICRTESFNCYRLTAELSYEKSGLCQGYIRSEAPDCCSECAPLDGKKYEFGESDDAHPNCRYAKIPWLK